MNRLSHLSSYFDFFSFSPDNVGLGAAIFIALILASFAAFIWQFMGANIPSEISNKLTPEKSHPPLHWRDIAEIELGEDGLPKLGGGSDFLFAAMPSFNNEPISPKLLADLLFDRFPALAGEEIELSATKNKDMLLIEINGFLFGLMHRDEKFMELAPEDLKDTIARSYHWKDANKLMPRQKSHFILAHIGAFPKTASKRLKAAKLMTIIAASLIENNQILAVYWSHTGNLYSADFWYNEALKLVTPQVHLSAIKTGNLITEFSTPINAALTDLKNRTNTTKSKANNPQIEEKLPYKLWMDIRFKDYGENNKLASIAGLDLFCDSKTGRMATDLDREEATIEAHDFIINQINQKDKNKYALYFQDFIMP